MPGHPTSSVCFPPGTANPLLLSDRFRMSLHYLRTQGYSLAFPSTTQPTVSHIQDGSMALLLLNKQAEDPRLMAMSAGSVYPGWQVGALYSKRETTEWVPNHDRISDPSSEALQQWTLPNPGKPILMSICVI